VRIRLEAPLPEPGQARGDHPAALMPTPLLDCWLDYAPAAQPRRGGDIFVPDIPGDETVEHGMHQPKLY